MRHHAPRFSTDVDCEIFITDIRQNFRGNLISRLRSRREKIYVKKIDPTVCLYTTSSEYDLALSPFYHLENASLIFRY